MADYQEYSVREVKDPDRVGTGTGSDPNGEIRVCVSLDGKRINPGLSPEWEAVNWSSLTPAAAESLFKQLHGLRHIWEEAAPPQRQTCALFVDGREVPTVPEGRYDRISLCLASKRVAVFFFPQAMDDAELIAVRDELESLAKLLAATLALPPQAETP